MKKISLALISLIAILVLVACGNASTNGPSSSSSASGSASNTPSAKGDRVLVAYFSESGNTQAVAQEIAERTSGDLYQIQPAQPFTEDDLDWTDRNSRVVREYENEDQRSTEVANPTPENWDDYDTVFVGFPLWWQQAPWPMEDFFTSNDFSGKTVIPFVTSMSSLIGDSAQNAAALAGSGNWQEGRRFSQSGNSADVADWLTELGY